jgi:hypothetical protein
MQFSHFATSKKFSVEFPDVNFYVVGHFFVQKKVQMPHKTLVIPNKSQVHQNGEYREQWVSIVNHLFTKARMSYIPEFLNLN